MTGSTFDVGPNIVAVIIALIAFATTVFNGVMAVRTSQKVKDVLAETKPNGGSSLRDQTDRIEEHAKVAAATAVALATANETAAAVDAAVAAATHTEGPSA